jgi:acyl-CoA synthetase (AMP-forming)/AMP-acid ligase II
MMTTEMAAGDLAVTQRLLGLAAARGSHQALAGGQGNRAYGYAELATAIKAAAAGLACRGLHQRDVVGVHVADAVCYAVATHAIRAAGGVPSPVAAGLSVPEIAGQLADCGARMLLTAPPLAAAALAAADRSWVRQVISFGDAPGATSFDTLLQSGSLQPAGGRRGDPVLLPYLRQPDGVLSPVPLTSQELAAELSRLAALAQIAEQDVVITVPPAGDGRAYSVLLDHALLSGATVVASPAADLLATAVAWRGTVAIAARREDVAPDASLRVLAVGS